MTFVLPHIDLWFDAANDRDDGGGMLERFRSPATRRVSEVAPTPAQTAADDAAVARVRGESEADARTTFETIYREHAPSLVRFVYGYTYSRTASEDVVADVFLSIWARRTVWAPHYGIRAYLYAAARHRALNAQRSVRRAERRMTEAAALDSRAGSATEPADVALSDAALEVAERRARLAAAVAALPDDARRLAELRWRDGMSAVEIAEIFGINRAAVDNRLSRLVKRLQAIALGAAPQNPSEPEAR